MKIRQHIRRFSRVLHAFCVAAAVSFVPSSLLFANSGTSPETVMALYVMKLTPFVRYGDAQKKVSNICYYEKESVSSEHSIGQQISALIQGDGAALSAIRHNAIREFSGCDILIIPAEEEANLDTIMVSVARLPMLTVSNIERFILKGGMIGFVQDNQGHIKMAANVKNMNSNNVKIDPRLLEIMHEVIE